MRAVEFAQHLGKHILEVLSVGDVWQELHIVVVHCLPVQAVDILVIELLVNLLPGVLENVFALLAGPVLEFSGEGDVLSLAIGKIHTNYAAAADHIDILSALVGNEAAPQAFLQLLDRAGLEVTFEH